MLCCVCVYLIFFFKQKTAYDLRISDWSSDVCSSDLVAQLGGEGIDQAALDTGLRDHAFALPRVFDAGRVAPARDHRLERRPGVAPGEVLAPADVEAAVRRLQRRYVQAAFAQHALPGTVGSELRPAADRKSTRLNSSH